ncbi:MAG: hypothetical protein JRE58_14820, partial [Deltaproteobacteria bacterium]|nr:hypothetical protein [Deltaproteobacteria bacterium]
VEWVKKIVRGDAALDKLVKAENEKNTGVSQKPESEKIGDREIKSTEGYDLLLQDWSLTRSSSGQHLYVIGQVKNISKKALPQVYAVARFFDGNKKLITYDKQFIELNPILPGQVSPFKITTKNSYEVRKVIVTFTAFAGGSIPHIDQRQLK